MFKRLAIFFLPMLWAITASAQVREFTVYEDRVLDAYLAYYGRPADPAGLAFWADQLETEGGNLDSISLPVKTVASSWGWSRTWLT